MPEKQVSSCRVLLTFIYQTLLILGSSSCIILKVLKLASIWNYLQGSVHSIFWANIDTKEQRDAKIAHTSDVFISTTVPNISFPLLDLIILK